MQLLKDLKENKSLKYFFVRLLLFLSLYFAINHWHSDITKLIYNYRITNNDSFFSYLIIPVFAVLIFFRWEKLKTIFSYKNKLAQTIFFSFLAIVCFLLPLKELITYSKDTGFPLQLIYYPPVFIGHVFLFLSIFNIKFIKKFKIELLLVASIILIYLGSQVLIESYWAYFSNAILYILGLILPIITKSVFIDPNKFLIVVEDFHAKVGPPCAGIYSLVTFLSLFIATLVLMQKNCKIHYGKAIFALLTGLGIIFLLNIIRIVIIIAVGAYYSPDLAYDLFHEYLSAIFLIGLFVVYLYFVFPRITKRQTA